MRMTMDVQQWVFLIMVLFIHLADGEQMPSCASLSKFKDDDWPSFIVHGTVPSKRLTKQQMTHIADIKTPLECAKLCCMHGLKSCQAIVFLHNNCYLVQCPNRRDCIPTASDNPYYASAYTLLLSQENNKLKPDKQNNVLKTSMSTIPTPTIAKSVNKPQSSSTSEIHDSSIHEKDDSSSSQDKGSVDDRAEKVNDESEYDRSCVTGIKRACRHREECVTGDHLSRDGVCKCKKGFTRDNENGGVCTDKDGHTFDRRPCRPDDEEEEACDEFEECRQLDDDEGRGMCRCIEDYVRDVTHGGICKPKYLIDEHSTKSKSPYNSTTQKSRSNSTNDPDELTTLSPMVSSKMNVPYSTPTANAGPYQVLIVPVSKIILNGSATDDLKHSLSYKWTWLSGPMEVETIEDADKVIAFVDASSLSTGVYTFQLTVRDPQGNTGRASVRITISKAPLQLPVARAGSEFTVSLGTSPVILDGSNSTADTRFGPAHYLWTPLADSLAAGRVIGNSDKSSILRLEDLVSGSYHWSLSVEDAAGNKATDSIRFTVLPEILRQELLELELDASVRNFTQQNKQSLITELNLLLTKSFPSSSFKAVIDQVKEDMSTGNLIVLFHVMDANSSINGVRVVHQLRPRLLASRGILDFPVIQLETSVCQSNCTGRGYCHRQKKVCICESGYLADHWRLHFGDGEPNCDWIRAKLFAAVILASLSFICVSIFIWHCHKKCKRRCKSNAHIKYAPLNDLDLFHSDSRGSRNSKHKLTKTEANVLSSDEENTLYSMSPLIDAKNNTNNLNT